MPVLKKKPTAKATKPAEWEATEGGQASFDDGEGNVLTGEILKINTKKGIATVQVAEDEYEVEVSDLSEPEGGEETPAAVVPRKGVKVASSNGKTKGKGSSFAKIFNSTPAAEGGAMGFPEGNWEALIVGGVLERGEKGLSAYFEFVGVGHEDVEGRTQRKYYQLLDADDEPANDGQGIGFLKKDLALLGHGEFEIDDESQLEAKLEEIAQEEPWVQIAAQRNKKNPQYVNLFLNGLMEDQADKPERPQF